MQLKKTIALFCLIVVCMQVLPVKQIGAILFNNQITEEIAHADVSKKQTAKNESDHYLLPHFDYDTQESAGTNNHNTQACFALVHLHYAEVPTPPPNVV
jgi:hypothetical protein